MDYDGRNRKTILEKGIPYPYGIALYQDRLYWTDWKTWFVKIFLFFLPKYISNYLVNSTVLLLRDEINLISNTITFIMYDFILYIIQ